MEIKDKIIKLVNEIKDERVLKVIYEILIRA